MDLYQIISNFDTATLLSIINLRTPLTDIFFSIITHAGSMYFLFLIGLFLFLKNRKIGAKFLIGFALNLILIFAFKQIIMRPRPFEVLEGIKILDMETSPSFPSGHSANAFFGSVALSTIYKNFSAIFYAVALLVALSRIYAGVHYPTDVLFGAIEGFLFSHFWFKYFDFKRIEKGLKRARQALAIL